MKLATLLSGGKDSVYATYLSIQNGHDVKYLVTIFPENKESWMFHHPCIELTKLQAKAMGIKQITQKTEGKKEEELKDLRKILEKIRNEIEGIASGAIASEYQKSRIEKICKELGLKSVTPLWSRNYEELLKDENDLGFKTIITGVFAEGFNKSWLGREIDEKCIEDLKELNKKFGINLCGEGGEYETFVLDCPLFKKRIKIKNLDIIWDNKTNSGYLAIKKAKLISK